MKYVTIIFVNIVGLFLVLLPITSGIPFINYDVVNQNWGWIVSLGLFILTNCSFYYENKYEEQKEEP